MMEKRGGAGRNRSGGKSHHKIGKRELPQPIQKIVPSSPIHKSVVATFARAQPVDLRATNGPLSLH